MAANYLPDLPFTQRVTMSCGLALFAENGASKHYGTERFGHRKDMRYEI